MSDKKAIIKVHYFFVSVAEFSDDSNSFVQDNDKKLEQVLQILQQKSVADRIWQPNHVMDNSINLQNAKKLDNGFWKLEFVKIRDEAMPGKINTEGVFMDIPLEENEYIGEDMTIIYAPDKHLLGVQRNFYSVSAAKVADYFSAMQSNFVFQFTPIIGTSQVPETAFIRSVEISCYDIDNVTLEEAIENSETYGARSVKYYYSVGKNAKNAGLKDTIRKLCDKFQRKDSCQAIKVNYKESENSPVSSIDLLDPKIEDKISISYSKEDKITHDKICSVMLPKFLERYNAL